jgi:hypothetical protein
MIGSGICGPNPILFLSCSKLERRLLDTGRVLADHFYFPNVLHSGRLFVLFF